MSASVTKPHKLRCKPHKLRCKPHKLTCKPHKLRCKPHNLRCKPCTVANSLPLKAFLGRRCALRPFQAQTCYKAKLLSSVLITFKTFLVQCWRNGLYLPDGQKPHAQEMPQKSIGSVPVVLTHAAEIGQTVQLMSNHCTVQASRFWTGGAHRGPRPAQGGRALRPPGRARGGFCTTLTWGWTLSSGYATPPGLLHYRVLV